MKVRWATCPDCQKKHAINDEMAERICIDRAIVENFTKYLKKAKKKPHQTGGQKELLAKITKRWKRIKKEYGV